MRLFKKKDKKDQISDTDPKQDEILNKIESRRKAKTGINRIIHNPLKFLTENPLNILIVSVPAAIIIFLAGFITTVRDYGIKSLITSTFIDDIFVITLVVALTPLAFFYTKEGMRIKNIEVALPNFFRDVAGMNESGMTLPTAIHSVANGDYGGLTQHIKKLDNEISWNVPFVEAIYRFGENLGTPLARRSVDLIAKASKAGGNVSEVLNAAANDSYEFVNLADERRNNMMIYVVIVLVSFLVFLFVIAIMTGTFLDTMAEAGEAASASSGGDTPGMSFGGSVDMGLYRRIFSHAAMIQGFFSGLVAGQMGEGSALSGLKYSLIMLLIAWVSFRFFI
ncbi:type II secretion system F family protein [Methanoplanus endosymbiosus]|uniref:Type II secretion system F family protein n=1 Tax=Methanoplanus endosymbiosus TaxID=33865 RepID=A0A9E7TIQ1_9EURY|nr:type II secretion system F family protein [Methanoplanus endosymbiosus]UUX92788.1 type II secretion system F family protein [Methanoplanus endosymbiosus]